MDILWDKIQRKITQPTVKKQLMATRKRTTRGTRNSDFRPKYTESHPWMTFQADLSRAPHDFWMLLGEIQSKCEHVANAILPPEKAQELLMVYMAKSVRATTAIEGNTMSENQVLEKVKHQRKRILPPSQEYLEIEVENVIEACNSIQQSVLSNSPGCTDLTVDRIAEFNRMVLKDLRLDEGVVPGEIPTHNVVVGNYKGAPRAECAFLLQKLCTWINEEIKPPSPRQELAFGVIKAVLSHLYLAWIHPFGDGNGRTARLMELHLLLASRVPNVAAHLLSNHYNLTRTEYYRQLEIASKTRDVVGFLTYAASGLRDGLIQAIEKIKDYQFEIAWRDFVYRSFPEPSGPAAARQRRLVLDLWYRGPKGASISKLNSISDRVSALYSTVSSKTLRRDLDALQKLNLIKRDGDNVAAQGSILLHFLPARRSS